MKQIYQTYDGKSFDNRQDAENHEQGILLDWLATSDEGVFCQKVLNRLDNTSCDEFYGTNRDFALVFVKEAFDMQNEVPTSADIMEDDSYFIRSEN